MDSELALINVEFGSKQLSGNLTLFKRLLGRFLADYESTSEKLAEFTELNNLEQMQMLVHTIKGVSGNLGLDKLQQIASALDAELKIGKIDASLIGNLNTVMESTLTEIKSFAQTSAETPAIEKPANTYNTQKLAEDLQRQRFISDDKLNEFLDNSNLSSDIKQSLKESIDQLDYDAALQIIQSE